MLSQQKVNELEFLAFRLNIQPDMLVDALISIGFAEKLETNKAQVSKLLTPEQKIKKIEAESLRKGWTYEQLWKKPKLKNYSEMGLICFIADKTFIGEVTEKHIALIHEKPAGEPVILNFYNMDAEQPWIKKLKTESI